MLKKLSNSLNLEDIFSLVKNKISSKEKGSYSYELSKGGTEKITRKIGEESVEVMIAAFLNDKKNSKKTKEDLIGEICDLFYHSFVLMVSQNIDFNDILKELNKRNIKKSFKK